MCLFSLSLGVPSHEAHERKDCLFPADQGLWLNTHSANLHQLLNPIHMVSSINWHYFRFLFFFVFGAKRVGHGGGREWFMSGKLFHPFNERKNKINLTSTCLPMSSTDCRGQKECKDDAFLTLSSCWHPFPTAFSCCANQAQLVWLPLSVSARWVARRRRQQGLGCQASNNPWHLPKHWVVWGFSFGLPWQW